MTVSAATRDKLNQWLNLKSPSGSDEQSLYDLLSLIEAYHSSFSMNTQRKLDDWLGSANDNLIGGGDGIGTTDFAKLRIATGGLQYNPWSLSSIEMQAFDEWLSLATDGLVTTYSGLVLATSPLAYWQLNEGSGATIIDSSGNGYNGSYTGVTLAADTTPQGTPAPFWDGVGDFGNVYSAGFGAAFDMDEGSVQAWVKIDWTELATRRILWIGRDANNFITLLHPATSGGIYFERRGATSASFQNLTVASGNVFQQMAMTWSLAANEFKCYYEGAQVGTTQTLTVAASGSGLSTTESVIGARNTTPSQVLLGYAAHVAIWDYALTPAQVAALGVV